MAVESIQSVRALAADGVISDADATALAGTTDPRALAALNDVLEQGRARITPNARAQIVRTLTMGGYVVPQRLSAPSASTFTRLSQLTGNTTNRVLIAMADGAIDFSDPLIARNAWTNPDPAAPDRHGWDFTRNAPLRPDGNRHGNATTALAVRGSGRVLALGASVVARDDYGPLWRAITYGIANGARIVNMSLILRTDEARASFEAIVARNPGVLFVMAAGNDGATLSGPTHSNLLVVGGSTARRGVWSGSATGAGYVDLAANADDIRVGSSVWDGTSFAAPQVSNVAAKCMLLNPALTAAEVARILCATADYAPAWRGLSRTEGILNADRAMEAALRA